MLRGNDFRRSLLVESFRGGGVLDLIVFFLCQALLAGTFLLAWGLLGRPTTRLAQDVVRGAACFGGALVLTALGAFWYGNLPATQAFGRLVSRVDTPDSVVALTFDDGPTPEGTRQVLPMLARRGVHATFFVNGEGVEKHMAEARAIVAAGHQLGNHGYTHAILIAKPSWRIRNEVEFTEQRIRAAGYLGVVPFRAPFNMKLASLPLYLSRTHRQSVTWDVAPDGGEADARDTDAIVRTALAGVRPGSIVLLHVMQANRAATLRAVPLIIDGLAKRGYRFVTVNQLLDRRATWSAADRSGGSRLHAGNPS
jgi:peptidoglycan/xylan/chitin deacetylase (PgdA/CDA1 family)